MNNLANGSRELVDLGLVVSRLVRAQMRRHTSTSITLPQLRALAYVNADPACGPSQLAEYLMLSRPAVTRVLDALAERHLITRHAHPDDRRRRQLSVTAAGRRHLDGYFARARAIVAERLADLSARDRAAVTRALRLVLPLFAGGLTDPATPNR